MPTPLASNGLVTLNSMMSMRVDSFMLNYVYQRDMNRLPYICRVEQHLALNRTFNL